MQNAHGKMPENELGHAATKRLYTQIWLSTTVGCLVSKKSRIRENPVKTKQPKSKPRTKEKTPIMRDHEHGSGVENSNVPWGLRLDALHFDEETLYQLSEQGTADYAHNVSPGKSTNLPAGSHLISLASISACFTTISVASFCISGG